MQIGISISLTNIIVGESEGSPVPSNAYVAEDGSTPYVGEDGITFYVTES